MQPVMQFVAGAPLPDLSLSNEETYFLLKRPEEKIIIKNQKSWTTQSTTTTLYRVDRNLGGYWIFFRSFSSERQKSKINKINPA